MVLVIRTAVEGTRVRRPRRKAVAGACAGEVRGVFALPAWCSAPELQAASRYAKDAIAALVDEDDSALCRLTRQILREELDFISNPAFTSSDPPSEIFAEALNLQVHPATAPGRRSRLASLPAHFGRMCEAELLTPQQEKVLFQRMNFLRYQALLVRTKLDPEQPSREGIELFRRLVAMADWHRDAIVQANLRLVFSIVKKFVNKANSFDDLLSDGIVALIRAVEKFDYDRGFRFSTYATQVVRRNAYRTVVQRQKEKLRVAGGLQELGLDVSDESRQGSISEHRWHDLRSRLTTMLGDLDRREKLIIRARFSLGSHRKVHTLQSLADRLGVSKERVRQLEKRALDKLRAMAGETKLEELEADA